MKQAEECAKKALAINHCTAKAWILLGDICLLNEKFDEALAHVEKGVACSPNDPLILGQLAYTMSVTGRHKEALSQLKIAMRLSP